MGLDLFLSDGPDGRFELIYVSSDGHAEIVGSKVPFAEAPVSDPEPRKRYERLLFNSGADPDWRARVTDHLRDLDAWIAEHPTATWWTL